VAMLWFFVGIAIVADTFMCSIEKITSKTKVVKIASPLFLFLAWWPS
jgi:solute carrier family 8 (sodium/calcium exchanger)